MFAGATPGFYLGNLGRVPVYADAGVVFLVFLAYMFTGFDFVSGSLLLLAFLIAIVCHEAGHAVVARFLRMDQVFIVISTLGGYCSFQGSPTHKERIAISVAGPLVNGLLALSAWLVLLFFEPQLLPLLDGIIAWLLVYVYVVNLFLGIFNILPIFPLDGGQIMLSSTMLVTRDPARSAKITLYTAYVFGALGFIAHMQFLNGGQPSIFMGVILFFLLTTATRILGR